jgi:tetratricopeptide (TPR) repeat protein
MASTAELSARAAELYSAGQLPAAEQLYRQILAIDPYAADALHMLGLIAYQSGDPARAAPLLEAAVRLQPDQFGYFTNLGLIYEALGRPADAAACYEQSLRLRPDAAETHIGLGNALRTLGRPEEAEVHLRQAVALRPDLPEAHNNLGNALARRGQLDEAVSCYEHALQLRPDYVEAHNNLGSALRDLGRLDEALAHVDAVLRRRPDWTDAHTNRAALLMQTRPADDALSQAEAHLTQALRLRPADVDAHWNRAYVWLLCGDYERGWPEYEWRWPAQQTAPRAGSRWAGGPLDGRTILLYTEQGLGDTIQFVRFAPLVGQHGGKVILECQPGLARLLQSAPGIDRVVARGEPLPAFDVNAPLLSVPGLLHTTLATIPRDVPYLHAPPDRIEHWRNDLATWDGFKVGIAWQGNPTFVSDRRRSIPLVHYVPLAAVPGVRLFSIQVGPGIDQLPALAGRFPVIDLGPRRSTSADPFQESAAILKNLDLVIASDSAVVHLGGALGVPIWVALCVGADWRWLLDRSDSPWYPTMRLFRQPRPGDWDAVFADIARALRTHVAGGRV